MSLSQTVHKLQSMLRLIAMGTATCTAADGRYAKHSAPSVYATIHCHCKKRKEKKKEKTVCGFIYEFIISFFRHLQPPAPSPAEHRAQLERNDCNSRPQKQGTRSPRANTKQSWEQDCNTKVRACLPSLHIQRP